MFTLIKKDWRVNRPAILGLAAIVVGVYALAIFSKLLDLVQYGNNHPNAIFVDAAAVALILVMIMAAVFGGAAFATERRDRSADFLAMFPVPRWQMIVSKLSIAVSFLVLAATINLAVFFLADRSSWRQLMDHAFWNASDTRRVLNGIIVGATCTATLFGVAWLLSSSVSSPAIAAISSIAVTAIWLLIVDGLIRRTAGGARDDSKALIIVMAGTGFVTWLGGTVQYMLRGEP